MKTVGFCPLRGLGEDEGPELQPERSRSASGVSVRDSRVEARSGNASGLTRGCQGTSESTLSGEQEATGRRCRQSAATPPQVR